jgi:hypothetical protein
MPTVIEQLARLPLFYPSLKMNKSIEHLLRERLGAYLDGLCILVTSIPAAVTNPGATPSMPGLRSIVPRTVLLARLIVAIAQRGSNHG